MKTYSCKSPVAGQPGFTLVEMSIVLIIIGALLYGVLQSRAIISSAKAKDIVAIVGDLRTASAYFKQRYGYLPGDLPLPFNYINATPPLTAAAGTNGNGVIDGAVSVAGIATLNSEVAQAPLQLYSAGFIGTLSGASPTNYLNTTYGPVQLVSAAVANGLVPTFIAANPTAINAIVFFNLPCDVANEVDTKLDDGRLTTGNGRGSAVCVGTNVLPAYALPL